MTKKCFYRGCKYYSKYGRNKNLKFYPFPKPRRNLEKCLKWLKLCGNDKLSLENLTKEVYICSKHSMGKFTKDSAPVPHSPIPATAALEPRFPVPATEIDLVATTIEEGNDEQDVNVSVLESNVNISVHKSIQTIPLDENTFSYNNMKKNPKRFKYFTGLTIQRFEILYSFLDESVMDRLIYPRLNYQRKVTNPRNRRNSSWSNRDRLCLTLVRLRRGFTLDELAALSNCSKSNVSIIFCTWVQFVYHQIIGMRGEIFRGSRKMKNIPLCFKNFEGHTITLVIDATEVAIQMPSNFRQQGNTFSNYKHSNTVKFLIGICTSGAIVYVSEGFEGAVSDRDLFERCDIKYFLEENDVIMADKGFLIQDILNGMNIKLFTPPLLGKRKRLTGEEELVTRKIARSRVHVERAISRIKSYRFLSKKCPLLVLPILSNIFTVVCFLVDFEKSLVK